jgi:hypothetical protein
MLFNILNSWRLSQLKYNSCAGFVQIIFRAKMVDAKYKAGDLIRLKERYRGHGKLAIIIKVIKTETLHEGGWITFDFWILTEQDELVFINSSCIEKKW